jgi:hypothetical protein
MTVKEYLSGIAHQLVHELEPILQIKEVTRNSALLGSYTEAAVRRLIRRVVHPMRVSTGAVIDFPMPTKLEQIDVVVWAPFPAPGIFEIDDFALVPRSSAFGLMEIKRSNYSGVDTELDDFDKTAAKLAAAPHPHLGVSDGRHPGMGIICVLEGKASARLQKLIDDDRAVAVFEKTKDTSTKAKVRPPDVLRLVNFLHYVSWRYRMQGVQREYPQLITS